jgi:small subunit ribosomal protein S9
MAIKKKQKSQAQKVVKKQKPVAKSAVGKAVDSSAAAVRSRSTAIKGVFVASVGRRKTATSRVRLYKSPGDFLVNGQPAGRYFAAIADAAAVYNKPLQVVGAQGQFGVTAKVEGSGIHGQIGAVSHALARALVKFNPDWRPLLKESGLLTRDDRMKESRKVGMGGKARRQRQSPKR